MRNKLNFRHSKAVITKQSRCFCRVSIVMDAIWSPKQNSNVFTLFQCKKCVIRSPIIDGPIIDGPINAFTNLEKGTFTNSRTKMAKIKRCTSLLGMFLGVLLVVTCHGEENTRKTSLGMSQELNHKDFLEMMENMTTVKVMLAFQVNRDSALYVDGLRVVLEDDSAIYKALLSFVQSKLQFIQSLSVSEASRNAIRIAFLSALEKYYNVPYGGITEKIRAVCLHRVDAKPCNTGTYWFLYDLQKSLLHERAKMLTMGTHPCWATIPIDLSKLTKVPLDRHLDGYLDHEDCTKLYRYNGYFTNTKDSLDVDTTRLGNADVDLSNVAFKKDVAAVHLPARGPRLCWNKDVLQCLHWYFGCSMAKVTFISDNKLRNCINVSLTTVMEEALENYYTWPYANLSYLPPRH